MNVGSLFSGIGGLDLAVEQHFGAELAWLCEYDQPARAVLKRRFPGVPCFPDVRELGADTPAVDILVGGYPCQPFSVAGLRRGEDDPRHLWPHFARLIRLLRPRVVVAENVAGHLRLGFDAVLADLASLGMDVRWGVVRASDAGAPHQRARVFIVAWDAARWRCDGGPDIKGRGPSGRDGAAWTGKGSAADAVGHPERRARPGEVPCPPGAAAGEGIQRQRVRNDVGDAGAVATDPVGAGDDADGRVRGGDPRQPRGSAQAALPSRTQVAHPADTVADGSGASADADRRRRKQRDSAVGRVPVASEDSAPVAADADGERREPRRGRLQPGMGSRGDARGRSADRHDGNGSTDWGVYAAAIRRWEHLTGAAAPRPTDDRGRLMPEFVEWMMDYPVGWTEGASRTQRLKMLGNAVVPAQALLALHLLTGDPA